MIVYGLTDVSLWGPIKGSVILWAVWGLTLAAHRIYVGDPERAAALAQAMAVVADEEPDPMPEWVEQPGLTASAP